MIKQNSSVCNIIRKDIEQGPLLMNLRGWPIWISLVEILDHIRCIARCLGGSQLITLGVLSNPFHSLRYSSPDPL